MIRYINIGNQITPGLTDTPNCFAFYDTITDRFMEFDGSQTWESWEEFEYDFNNTKNNIYPLSRFERLVPESKKSLST